MGPSRIKGTLTVLKLAFEDRWAFGMFIIVIILISFLACGLLSDSNQPKIFNFVEASVSVLMFYVFLMQLHILSKQNKIQAEQTEISKISLRPHLFVFTAENRMIQVKNASLVPAYNLSFSVEVGGEKLVENKTTEFPLLNSHEKQNVLKESYTEDNDKYKEDKIRVTVMYTDSFGEQRVSFIKEKGKTHFLKE